MRPGTAGNDRVAEQAGHLHSGAGRSRRETAVEGVHRALAALREATGIGTDTRIAVVDSQLPDLTPTVTRDDVVAQALAGAAS